MARYRNALPQLGNDLFVTDGGLETTLIYHDGIDLPAFAAFDLLKDARGTNVLRRYYETYARIARDDDVGLVLESATWRANGDWGERLGYDAKTLAVLNFKSIDLLAAIRQRFESPRTRIVISGAIGPRGDSYVPDQRMSARAARDYHACQVENFSMADADMVAAYTINYVDEAVGIARAARAFRMPVAISFTLETNGRLPSGQSLEDAIAHTDADTDGYVAYYMINCAHPTHFAHVLADGGSWTSRIRGLRANASTRSHAELDAATELDCGDPARLAVQYRALTEVLPQLTVVGGCCGTDDRHIERICSVLTETALAA